MSWVITASEVRIFQGALSLISSKEEDLKSNRSDVPPALVVD